MEVKPVKVKNWIFTSLFLFAILFSPIDLLATSYYESKVIKIVVGSAPGGGYDRMARLFAKYIPKYIPGKPSIVVENITGASSISAANYVYNVAKPDGLTLGAPMRNLPFAQLLKAEGTMFDLAKFSWIGSAASESAILVIRTDLPYKTFDDLLKAKDPIYLSASGPGTTDYQFPILLKEYLGLNAKMVMYSSSADGILAVERKEVDGRMGSYSALKQYIERGLVRPVIRGRVSEPGIENLPVNEDLTKDNRAKTVMAMLSAADKIGRPFVAPPGTPADVTKVLRDAFAKVSKDPELIDSSKKMMMAVEFLPAGECLKVLDYVLSQPEDIVKEFGKYIKF